MVGGPHQGVMSDTFTARGLVQPLWRLSRLSVGGFQTTSVFIAVSIDVFQECGWCVLNTVGTVSVNTDGAARTSCLPSRGSGCYGAARHRGQFEP